MIVVVVVFVVVLDVVFVVVVFVVVVIVVVFVIVIIIIIVFINVLRFLEEVGFQCFGFFFDFGDVFSSGWCFICNCKTKIILLVGLGVKRK